MYAAQSIIINQVSWQDQSAQQQLRTIREQVFLIEQNVPIALEWDDDDAGANHILVEVQDTQTNTSHAVACARIVDYDKIGRMAVLSPWRQKGIGKALLNHCIATCKSHQTTQIKLSAQTHAIAFYANAGFKVISEPYVDAGIMHVDMVLAID